jgi:AraC-like DNA-binding protein
VRRPGIESTIVNYCVKGAGWCELLGRRFVVKPGDVMVVPNGTAHAYGSDTARPWSIYWFHAMGDNVPLLLAELSVSRERPVVHLGQRGELVALFTELGDALENDYSRPQLLYASRVLTHLWGLMIQRRRDASQKGDDTGLRVYRTLEHMQRHFERPMKVETLATMAGLSASQYSARFRELTGHCPKKYLLRLRIHRAAQLLDQSSESVASIARHVGYDDPLYFSRAFRLIHDICPSGYRNQPATHRSGVALDPRGSFDGPNSPAP